MGILVITRVAPLEGLDNAVGPAVVALAVSVGICKNVLFLRSFISDVTLIWEIYESPPPSCHNKMVVLLTPFYIVGSRSNHMEV